MCQVTKSGFLRVFQMAVHAGATLGLLLVIAMPAWGNSSHDHHKAVSPFTDKGNQKNPHCLLNQHYHGNVPCPHSLLNIPKKNLVFYIGLECGGNKQGSIPVKTGFDHQPAHSGFIPFKSSLSGKRERTRDFSLRKFYLSNPLPPPPKSV